ncbi:uncharacterized protein SOCE26_029950 [Sorangium cellulosum]|uniref:Uncharacterized protein n=1 Tax=Sorangium cellulosum TaxID=56 RepID=A0A2L0EQL1_SORCE|nr:uncharacterized protein SOCE26_029950 [Sorangium cellulosum]
MSVLNTLALSSPFAISVGRFHRSVLAFEAIIPPWTPRFRKKLGA